MYLRALIRTSQFQFHSSIVCSWSRFCIHRFAPSQRSNKKNMGVRYVYVVKTSRYLIDSHKDETNSISNICPLCSDPPPPHTHIHTHPLLFFFYLLFFGKLRSDRKRCLHTPPLSMLGTDNTRKRFLGWKRKLEMNIVWLKGGENWKQKTKTEINSSSQGV